jgi:hypothetical protein
MHGISRAESKRSRGWLVRLYRDGNIYSKFFSDSRYRGKRKAFEVALKHLHSLEQQFPREKLPFRTTPLRRSKTGINGVCLTYHRDRTGAKLRCYSVHYRLNGRPYNKRFYLHWYEDPGFALKEAAAFRKEMEAVMLREWKKQNGHQR